LEKERLECKRLQKEIKATKGDTNELLDNKERLEGSKVYLSQVNPLDSVILEDNTSVIKSEDFDLSITKSNGIDIGRTIKASQDINSYSKEMMNLKEESIEEVKESMIGSQIETPKSSMMNSVAGKYISNRQSNCIMDLIVTKARRNFMMNELSSSIVGSRKFIKSLKSSFQACETPSRMNYSPTGRLQLKLPSKFNSTETSTTLISSPKTHLFEEFFIISAPLSSVETVKIIDFAYLPPTVLFQYPNLPENTDW